MSKKEEKEQEMNECTVFRDAKGASTFGLKDKAKPTVIVR